MRFLFPFAVLPIVLLTLNVPSSAQSSDAAIAFGNRHAVALRTNGDVLTWGENVYCQLGRTTRGNDGRNPAIVMRNAKAIAAAGDHTVVVTFDGKVYGWGMNPDGALGTGDTNDQCEGPVLVESLAGETVTHIASGHGFTVAVTSAGDLYCSGDNSMGQCPVAGRTGRVTTFTKIARSELAGTVADVRAGLFHTLILTKDRTLYALGRGLDGQLGGGKAANGFAVVSGMTDVVSFGAGTWHSVAARADGSVWTWGNGSRSQLCDGTTENRAVPARVTLLSAGSIAQVAAGGHGTLMRTADGAVFGCGDNQSGPLGIAQPRVAQATAIALPPVKSSILAIGGANAAVSIDGCDVRLAGSNDHGIVSAADSTVVRSFTARSSLSLCGVRSTTPLPTVVNPAPRGGVSGCWTTRVQEDAVASPRFAGLSEAMLAAEALLKKNAAFLAAPQPVRFRTSMSAGPSNESGAHMHVKAVPERKSDGTRLWTTGCDVIPQVDRIGGALAQISIFFNQDAREQFVSPVNDPPTLTGTVAGYPEYNGWVLMTKDGRLPWIPKTLADLLDEEQARREKAVVEARRRPAGLVPDSAAGGITWVEKQVRDLQQYRASFSPEQLRSAGVSGDPAGDARKRLDAEVAVMRRLSAADQQQVDALGLESRTLERQAQAEIRNKNNAEAERLRAQSTELAKKVREIRQAHLERTAPLIIDRMATYELERLQPGPDGRALRVKPDPAFPDRSAPNRIQMISVLFSFGPKPTGVQLDWQTKTKESFDFAALAAMLR